MKGSTSRSLTGDQVDEVASKYRKGATIEELAAEYKCSTAPIRNALRMRCVTMRRGSTRPDKLRLAMLKGRA